MSVFLVVSNLPHANCLPVCPEILLVLFGLLSPAFLVNRLFTACADAAGDFVLLDDDVIEDGVVDLVPGPVCSLLFAACFRFCADAFPDCFINF